MPKARKPYCRGRVTTVDPLVLTSLNLAIFILKLLNTFVSKQTTLMRRSNVLSLPLQLVFPAQRLQTATVCKAEKPH